MFGHHFEFVIIDDLHDHQRVATRVDSSAKVLLAGKEREAAVINAALEKRARKNAHRLQQKAKK